MWVFPTLENSRLIKALKGKQSSNDEQDHISSRSRMWCDEWNTQRDTLYWSHYQEKSDKIMQNKLKLHSWVLFQNPWRVISPLHYHSEVSFVKANLCHPLILQNGFCIFNLQKKWKIHVSICKASSVWLTVGNSTFCLKHA